MTIGSRLKWIGDSVNLASRVEALTKHYSSVILITEFTKNKLVNKFNLVKADNVTAKGKTESFNIYKLNIEKEIPDEIIRELNSLLIEST